MNNNSSRMSELGLDKIVHKGPRKSSANPPRINYMKEVLQQSCEILFKDLIN